MSWSRLSACVEVFGFGPVDDPFLGVPLIDMQTSDFLNPLAGQHDDLDGAGIGGMNRGVGAFQPAIEPDELFFAQPACADGLGFGRYAGGGVIGQPEATRGGGTIVVLGFQAPAKGGSNVAAYMIGH